MAPVLCERIRGLCDRAFGGGTYATERVHRMVNAWANVRMFSMNLTMWSCVALVAMMMLLLTAGVKLAGYHGVPDGSAVETIADLQDADALYADRSNLASARQAADLWTSALTRDPRSFDSAWK